MYFSQLMAKNESYIVLQEMLQQKPQISSLNDVSNIIYYYYYY